jgi:signal transduction histidine kinase
MSVLFLYETYQESSSSAVVENSKTTRLTLEKIFSGLKDREATILHFALTMDSAYWKNRIPASYFYQQLNLIDTLIDDNPIQRQNLDSLKDLFDSSIRHQEAVAFKLQSPGYMKSGAFRLNLKGSSGRMDSIGMIIERMQAFALALAKERSIDAQKHTIIATMMGVTVSIFSIIVFILAFYFIDQELKRSQDYLDETQTLNTKIGEINKELEEANRNLHELNVELEGKNFQLEKFARELSSFTHITSHDMQEPLRKIEFYISIVETREKQNLSEDGKKYLEKIKRSVGRMRQLFLSMLDFSLTNTVDNIIEEVDLNDVLKQTRHSLKVYINDTNTIIESAPLPTVKGIRYQLLQLFENIVSNAIKFRKPDVFPEIQITCEILDTGKHALRGLKNNHQYYKIQFRDNGIGFESQYAEKIFEIFQRLLPRSDAHGVGIGLAICRKIAENHGGTLVATSNPEAGAVFSFYIPAG